MRADRSEAACKRHRHHEKLSPKKAASFVSPLNTSAPALFSSASLFCDRPSARTLSGLEQTFRDFPSGVTRRSHDGNEAGFHEVKILIFIFKVTPTQQFADVRRIDFRPRFANCALPSPADASKEIIVLKSAR